MEEAFGREADMVGEKLSDLDLVLVCQKGMELRAAVFSLVIIISLSLSEMELVLHLQ